MTIYESRKIIRNTGSNRWQITKIDHLIVDLTFSKCFISVRPLYHENFEGQVVWVLRSVLLRSLFCRIRINWYAKESFFCNFWSVLSVVFFQYLVFCSYHPHWSGFLHNWTNKKKCKSELPSLEWECIEPSYPLAHRPLDVTLTLWPADLLMSLFT